MNGSIDLNADLGEGGAAEGELLALVSSANIACGFHAGNPTAMSASILAAKEAGVAVGAHPSLDDRANFGRREMAVSTQEVFALMTYQLGAFQAVANSLGMRPRHVKPHGALYNMAVQDAGLAEGIAHALLAIDRSLILFAPDGSAMARAAEGLDLRVAREVFADRNYLRDGSLVPRSRPDALLHDAEAAAIRVVRMLQEEVVRAVDGTDIALKADTICLHGDKPEAVDFARLLREHLAGAGITIEAPAPNK